MAVIPLLLGTTHHPFYYQITRGPRSQWEDGAAGMADAAKVLEERLSAVNPDALVVVATDHFHQFFMDNMPAFLIAKMDVFDGPFYNETRDFDLPEYQIPGAPDLADELTFGMLSEGVDLSFSNEMKLDHAVLIPLLLTRPRMDIPIVPLMTNLAAPPMPEPRRFVEVGAALRGAIEAATNAERVAVLVSGNLSLEVGGPKQFGGVPPDVDFDERVTEMMRKVDADALVQECAFDKLTQSGNVTHQFVNFALALGMAEGHMECTYGVKVSRGFANQPFFMWEPRT